MLQQLNDSMLPGQETGARAQAYAHIEVEAGTEAHTDSQKRAPYVEALQRHADAHPLHLMVPGHSNDASSGAAYLAAVFGSRVTELDVPLMLDGIDLGDDSPLAEALQLAAEAWGARRAWFLTNGASQGNRTAALAVRGLGERVLMQRSSHSSFTDGVLLAGLIPAFVAPSVDVRNGIAHGLTPASLEDALAYESESGRPVSSVYVVSPSYFGSTADVAGLAEVAHRYGAALVVDGAWGAHFGFHPELPESPARLGADLVISSTHKLAGSLTQSAMLLLGDTPFAERLEPLVARAFTMTSSTSASAILMGSLDAARHALVQGAEKIGRAIHQSNQLRQFLRADPRFSVISDDFGKFADIVAIDPLRVPIDVSRLGQSGHWVRERLITAHGTYLEMSTATSVVAVIGALSTLDLERLYRALVSVADEADDLRVSETVSAAGDGISGVASGAGEQGTFPPLPAAGTLRMLPRAAYFAESVLVPAERAIGRVSADTLAAYPPGIPNLMPGEEITRETVAFLQAVAASPTGFVRGAADPQVETFRVVRDPVTASLQA
ncbi:aminotransferase class I/II-fold pyridoxal phosphate-dependent enzyme [Leucobacter sp. W1478]|uniref:aminotransferase class I/II-fold pyridoxal phosphate-dependent enzyme n=1 Tax=Leucobacter sp. W1478 TaxID=3439065 RepID=UPI003F40426B